MKKGERNLHSYLFNFIIILLYLCISWVYYAQIWQQVFVAEKPGELITQGETHIYEFVAEEVRNNIVNHRNPFFTDDVLYPAGWNFSIDDVAPINGVFFLFLRPLFSIHQAFMFITVMSVVASNLTMYYFIRQLGHTRTIAFISGLVYGSTPFVSYRIWGHPTYVALYLFVLPAIFLFHVIRAKTPLKKMLAICGLAASGVLLILTNLYFVIMAVLMVGILCILYLLFERKVFIKFLNDNIHSIISALGVSLVVLAPWISQGIHSVKNSGYPPALSPTDSIPLSGDIMSIVWPARNPFYEPILGQIRAQLNFFPWVEAFMYPGIMLLIGLITYPFIRKKLPSFLRIPFFGALLLYFITLGPFIKLAGHVSRIQLPFMFIAQIPFFQMARAPARFVVPVLFLLTIINAYVLDYVFNIKAVRRYTKNIAVLSTIIAVILLDQAVLPFPERTFFYPEEIYSYIGDHKNGPLLEIPFVIRDGTKNFGSLNSVWIVRSQLYHDQPIFSLYAGRVPQKIFENFQTDPLFGPLGKLIDKEASVAGRIDIMNSMRYQEANDTINHLMIHYVLLKTNEAYSPQSTVLLQKLNFEKVMSEDEYSLWKRKI